MDQNTARRALIVVDVQNEYFDGKLRIEYPDPQVSLANIGRAMDAAHAAGVPVVIVQDIEPPHSPLFTQGSPGADVHASVAARPHAHWVVKGMPSAFANTGLEAWLAERGINTIAVVGYMTHNCDDSTVKHAVHAGLNVELLGDATGSVPYANSAGQATAEEIHRVLTVVMQSRFAAVMSTDAWIAGLNGAPMPARDNIYASNQRALELARRAA
ncbi:cysteine hydrolase family protein [Bordetella petrii]|uniref:cysteine hydrolase family protein n=1 Tax=Bordetella petrii TaxID=94624 RepID=UPI001E3E4932|nr:cysteine hydrolase family protein [Bordetella petrii]MCD0502913.1 cysteine hydrolase [Bordetella petrii]